MIRKAIGQSLAGCLRAADYLIVEVRIATSAKCVPASRLPMAKLLRLPDIRQQLDYNTDSCQAVIRVNCALS
jgi:hypothetical protein